MQIHGPSDEADGSTFTARLNSGTIEPFAVVQMGHVHFYAHTPGECDAAIRVWTEAKQLLLAAAGQDDGEPPLPCDSTMPKNGGHFVCTLDAGHYGAHSALGGMHRWLGHGQDARHEDGTRIIAEDSGPEQVTS